MDDKPNVIKMIDYAIMIEENAIVFYAEGIEKELQWSNFDSEKKKVIMDSLRILRDESIEHKKEIEAIRKEMRAGKK